MVVVSAPDVNKICELFTNNPVTRSQGNSTVISIMGINKECISTASELESDFGGGQHGCA